MGHQARAYYNEINPFAAQWLRNLIDEGHIAPGDVDERSIRDVRPDDLAPYTQCHFFAGIGVWSYALRRAGWHDDRRVWTGSCPCQPFSNAGNVQRGGFADERHLWPEMHRLITECRPERVYGEQVASADGLAWLDLVWSDMEASNYAFGAVDLCAAGFGAPHIRQRLFWVGDSVSERLEGHTGHEHHGKEPGRYNQTAPGPASSPSRTNGFWGDAEWFDFRDGKQRPVEPGIVPMVDGPSEHVGRLRAYGNAIVAEVAAGFIGSTM